MNQPIIQVQSIVKEFHSFRAIGGKDGLSFEVSAGSFLGLIGPNGAGKSTTFNLISGVLKPTSGRVLFNGSDLSTAKVPVIADFGIGRTFQTPRAFPSLSVLENVMVGPGGKDEGAVAAFLGRWHQSDATIREEADAVLEQVGLAPRRHDMVDNLSGGELRMLEIARQLIRKPKILLLDEPTAGVDPALQQKLSDLLVDLHVKGTTMIVVEHNLAFLMNLADSIVVLQGGALLAQGTPDVIRRDPVVISAYLGADHEA